MFKKITAIIMVLAMFVSFASFTALAEEAPKQVRYVCPGNPIEIEDQVYAAINEKLKADGLNIEFSVIRIPWDVWDQKSMLMIASGEEFELLHVMQDLKTLGTLYGQGAIKPITELINSDKYADLKSKFNVYEWREVTSGGEVLAVPTTSTSNDGKQFGDIYFRKDIADAAGLKKPTTIDEVIQFSIDMQNYILETEGVMTYVTGQRHLPYDWMIRALDQEYFYVDNTGMIQILQDGTVKSFVETEEFKTFCDIMNRLYEAGQINPDILTDSWGGDENTWTLAFDCHEFYLLPQLQQDVPEAEIDVIRLHEEDGKGDFIHFFSWNCKAIPATCKNDEAALDFLQWLYSSKENHDMLMYGVEGLTYTSDNPRQWTPITNETGAAVYEHGDWMTAYRPYRRFNTNIPLDIAEYSVRDRMQDDPPATMSPYVGFVFDATPISNTYANLMAEYQRALDPITYGLETYEDGYEEALSILKAAGLDEFVAEYQRQFAEYYAANVAE